MRRLESEGGEADDDDDDDEDEDDELESESESDDEAGSARAAVRSAGTTDGLGIVCR